MTPKEFFLKWNGVGLDFDNAFGFQCVDLFKQYNQDVIGGPATSGNAINYWTNFPTAFYDKIPNSPTNFPQEGDVVIWGTGMGIYGHIAVCYAANINHFTSFDQNYPIGSVCHFQTHNYVAVLGWLRPKTPVYPPPQSPVITDQTKIPQIENREVQAIRSERNDMIASIANLTIKIEKAKADLE